MEHAEYAPTLLRNRQAALHSALSVLSRSKMALNAINTINTINETVPPLILYLVAGLW
jgi:hypothetical protein